MNRSCSKAVCDVIPPNNASPGLQRFTSLPRTWTGHVFGLSLHQHRRVSVLPPGLFFRLQARKHNMHSRPTQTPRLLSLSTSSCLSPLNQTTDCIASSFVPPATAIANASEGILKQKYITHQVERSESFHQRIRLQQYQQSTHTCQTDM
jgi:hypothetical protein